jgi:HAD superfamily hydrolase (TIGR01509 family)
MSKYTYALFDWDGCLADTLSNSHRICDELAAENGINFTAEIFKQVVGDWDKGALAAGFTSTADFKDRYSKLMAERNHLVGLNLNAAKALKDLSESGVAIGVVTSSSKGIVSKQAESQGVLRYISHIVGFEDVTNTKPDPEPVHKLMELLGAAGKTASAVLIGDTEKDIIAASRAGIDSVWYAPQSNIEIYGQMDFENHQPTYTISDFSEVLRFFKS